MGWADGERNLMLYINDGRIAGRDHKWVQYALTVTLAMLCRMGINANLKKIKAMVCTPSFIWGKWGETLYKKWETGEGAAFREMKRIQASCTECGVTVAASHLKAHMV